ncbi:MAG TPA: hypothetical protein VLI90_15675 [Tepidisphaeraceae bacterium]|nr:hypothetical protein [Tepidisphaeraceae bacterium]
MSNHDKQIPALLIVMCSAILLARPIASAADLATNSSKLRVAVFPLAGSASPDQREKVGFALRAKLDRDDHYEPIDGPTMQEAAGDRPIAWDISIDALRKLVQDEQPQVLVWGQLDSSAGGLQLRLKTFDVDQPDPLPHEFQKTIAQPTDVRFAVEDILQTLQGVKRFEHPVEDAVHDDAKARELFAHGVNLVLNGDFSKPSGWEALLGPDIYPPAMSATLPPVDKVVIYSMPDDKGGTNNVLAMNLSKDTAENNGLACLSAPTPIKPDMRYRLRFRYRSDGPTLHVFVKGYTTAPGLDGKPEERECYRRQVPPSGATDGKWVTVDCDLNPQHVVMKVEHLRVDLYAYLKPGVVMFDDVELKAVGEQTRHAADAAIKPPATRPAK